MYLVISLLVLRAGCGIWLYQFLIIAYLFNFETWNKPINKNDNKAWFGSRCKIARRKYHRAKKKYNKIKTAENKRLLNLLSKEYKRTMNRYINKYNHGKEQKLREMHSKSPKQYWHFLNSIKGKSKTKTPSVEVFYEYFEKLNQNDSSHSQDGLDDLDFQDEEDLLNSKITESEILTAISTLKNGKSPGEF